MSDHREPKAPMPRNPIHLMMDPRQTPANFTSNICSTIGNQTASMSDNQVLRAPTSRTDIYYKMDHGTRGKAVIFNHAEYTNNRESARDGSDIDCAAFEECLRQLRFDVEICENFKFNDILEKLETVARMDHSDSDCLLIAVFTHGDLGVLAADDQDYEIDIIFSPFTGDKCKTLAGKPKIFVIQACQGGKVDEGLYMESPTVADYNTRNTVANRRPQGSLTTTFNMPNEADFIIAYATPPGFVAGRRKDEGSWFIRALCAELRVHGTSCDLGTVFTFVCKRVALLYRNDYRGQRQQIPCITSRLTHLIQF